MAVCVTCGNDYDKAFELTLPSGETLVFDCFECAIHRVAVECAHCGCRILGHGVEARGEYYCCAHCAQESGVTEIKDRAG